MAVFDPDADADRLEFQLMYHSFVTLFWRMTIFDDAVAWMRRHRYTVVLLDASRWTSDADLHRDIAAALEFPAYYGRNLDALNDCLRDVVDYEYGTTRDATGLVLALTDYDTFVARSPRSAQIVLDIIADQARCAAITGHRILCLVHSRDPKITFEPVGAMDVTWNRAEWFSARRQPGAAPHPLITE